MLAGVAEFFATERGVPAPGWVDQPDRFAEPLWFVSSRPEFDAYTLANTPAALMSDKSDRLQELSVRFARSAGKLRISKDSSQHVIAHYRVRFEESPPPGSPASRSIRLVYIGEDVHGRALEVMAVERDSGELLVIHAMLLREKYRRRYEEAPR